MAKAKKIHIEWEPRKGELIAAVLCLLTVVYIGIYALVAYTPVRRLIPGYPSQVTMEEMEVNAMKMDSLQRCIYRWELYSGNLREILAGGTPSRIDSILRTSGGLPATAAGDNAARADSLLRAKMGTGREGSSSYTSVHRPPEGRHFFTPVKGSVKLHFDASTHPYVEIEAPGGSPVTAVLEGTVIFRQWDEESGWTLILQHTGGLISIYSNLFQCFKGPSDKISAGTAIAINGQKGGEGSYLHFELWQNGNPEDPEHFINF